jgi:hypothetical protein
LSVEPARERSELGASKIRAIRLDLNDGDGSDALKPAIRTVLNARRGMAD